MWQPTISSDELYHHGILGMKWGDRNGPPYPLDAEDHSQSEKKAGWRKSLTDEQKANIYKAAKITTGVLLAGAVVGGTIYLAKTGKLDDVIAKGKKIVESKAALQSDFANAGKGIKSAEKVISTINPSGSGSNCGPCAIAFEAAQRGIPVHAKNMNDGMKVAQMGQMFKGINKDTFMEDFSILNSKHFNNQHGIIALKPDKIQQAFANDLSDKYPDGARGLMFVPRAFGQSHYISWEKKNGVITFFNSQNPKINIADDVFGHYKFYRNAPDAKITAMRLDNLEFNMDNIGEVVESNSPIKRILSSKLNTKEFNANLIKGKNYLSFYNKD